MLAVTLAYICLTWYIAVILVCAIGSVQIFRYYRCRPKSALSVSSFRQRAPHVTVIRPCKGIEPCLYECLAATFQQDYPIEKLTIYLCISSHDDPALPILRQVLHDHPTFDAKILVEDDDPRMHPDHAADLGPNPKIRNMSRAYREAKGDIVWIIDCNVWVGRGVCGRMVDTLCGLTPNGETGQKYKFVHQLPLAVDITPSASQYSIFDSIGGRLDELFLASSHAKFYTAINTVLIAPCIVGKSNMFRRSHLNHLTTRDAPNTTQHLPGLDYFSHNICEDHLIGDLLWRNAVPYPTDLPPASSTTTTTTSISTAQPKISNHALLPHDPCIQPISTLPLRNYTARRTRWLRVRKFTVPVATLVEPGTESLLCSAYGAWGLATLYDWPAARLLWPWALSVAAWMALDRAVYVALHARGSVELDAATPRFVRPPWRRGVLAWAAAWALREVLALPVWVWAVFGGTRVVWRGRAFRVGVDMRVTAVNVGGERAAERGGVGRKLE